MGITREQDGIAAADTSAGHTAFWAGEPYRADRPGDWSAGWLAAAAEARQTATEHRALIDRRSRIVGALREAYAALRNVSDMARVTPGNRNRCRSALELIGLELAYLEPGGGDTKHLRPRGRA